MNSLLLARTMTTQTATNACAVDKIKPAPLESMVKWSWACRSLPMGDAYRVIADPFAPRVGDVAVVAVAGLGHHTRINTADHGKLPLYVGDRMLGVFGNRYATDAYEAEVDGLDHLHQLTDAGMIGTVRTRHTDTKSPTKLRFVGYLTDAVGERVNLKDRGHAPATPTAQRGRLLAVVGTSMNSGKTTSAAKLINGLATAGHRVSACKVTGSVCQNDRNQLFAAGACAVRDFSDYGFPSTYLAGEGELIDLFHRMMADVGCDRPDFVVMEIADGLLQQETDMLLRHPAVRERLSGVVLAAPCVSSALFGVHHLQQLQLPVVTVTGRITNSPLFVGEYRNRSAVPVCPSVGSGEELAAAVTRYCEGAR